MRAEICHFLPGMRAGRRLSDLLLCSFVLFLSGTAVHIIKAVAQLEIVSLSAGVSAGRLSGRLGDRIYATLFLSLTALIFLTRRCASLPYKLVSELLTKKTALFCSFILVLFLSETAVHMGWAGAKLAANTMPVSVSVAAPMTA